MLLAHSMLIRRLVVLNYFETVVREFILDGGAKEVKVTKRRKG